RRSVVFLGGDIGQVWPHPLEGHFHTRVVACDMGPLDPATNRVRRGRGSEYGCMLRLIGVGSEAALGTMGASTTYDQNAACRGLKIAHRASSPLSRASA